MNRGSMTPARIYLSPDRPKWRAENRQWQGIPAVERTAEGRLYACWYSGGRTEEPGNGIVLETSLDDGHTWTDGFALILHDDPEVRCFDAALWIDPKGRLWVTWAQSYLWYDNRAGVWAAIVQDPDAASICFTEPRRLFHGIMLNKPTVAFTGEWLFPVSLWDSKLTDALCSQFHPELAREALANVYVTADGGQTFQRRGGVDLPGRAYDEHSVVELEDGRWWMLVRTRYGIGQAFSGDGGRTWQDLGPSGHTGPNSRFFIRRLRSGHLLLVNHVNPTYQTDPKPWNARNNLMAMLSRDDGKTWEGGLMIDPRDQVSYPDGVQADNGEIYLLYDRERRDARQILMAVFTEEDVLQGRMVSPNGRLRQVVSQAAGKRAPYQKGSFMMNLLPPLLRFEDGRAVQSPEDWASRREEILTLLRDRMFGDLPETPAWVRGTVCAPERKCCCGHAVLRKIKVSFPTEKGVFDLPVHLFLPGFPGRKPLFLMIGFRESPYGLHTPVEEILDNGFALAYVCYEDISADNGDFTDKLAGCFSGGGDAWGKIALWAWGMRRVIDGMLDQPEIDPEHIGVIGHSRLGKTALWCGAQDTRVRYVFVNDSGCGGAALERLKHEGGERVADITKHYGYWFRKAYAQYAGRPEAMPFDQHFLLGAIAPRYVAVGSAELDRWADPYAEQLCCMAASPAWRLHGLAGYAGEERPARPGDTWHQGEVGYHLRDGIHDLGRADWQAYMAFVNGKRGVGPAAPVNPAPAPSAADRA